MAPHLTRGFTLIELLVVIAIIGILSAVVVASLGTARNKGSDASVQEDLHSVGTQAELYYSTAGNNSYGTATVTVVTACNQNLWGDPTIGRILTNAKAAAKGNIINCFNTGSLYILQAQVNSTTTNTTYWCVDSGGNQKYNFNAITTSSTSC